MKLKVLSDYRCRDVHYAAGLIIEIDEVEARRLMNDAEGCFEVVEGKGVEKPPKHKMVEESEKKKDEE
jgi:hypothetical protein